MLVKLRFGRGPLVKRTKGKNRGVALGLGALLTPAAVMASVLGFWRLAADMRWTGEFGISSGVFSHWQVWLSAAAFLQYCSWALRRYAQRDER